MLSYDFMLRAFAASGVVALIAGIVGYFLVLRGQTFAGHALSHVGFAGAAGAALVGIQPLWGVVVFTLGAGGAMGLLGEKLAGRDVAVGIILAAALAFGVLFLSLNTSTTLQATTVLFGNVLAVSPAMLATLAALGAGTLVAFGFVSRPLLYASLQPELAEAKGLSPRRVATLFMLIVALAVAQSVQIVGVLLVFVLLVGPPAAAQQLVHRLGWGVVLSALFAVGAAWLGIAIAYYSDWPTSFCITAVSAAVYFIALAIGRYRR